MQLKSTLTTRWQLSVALTEPIDTHSSGNGGRTVKVLGTFSFEAHWLGRLAHNFQIFLSPWLMFC